MENDLLNPGANGKTTIDGRKVENGSKSEHAVQNKQIAPDGGALAWSIMVAAFLTNGILFGTINSAGTISDILKEQLKDDGDPDAESKSSLVGSLMIGTTFFLSPVSGVLTDAMGIRQTAVFGGAIATAGVLLSSFFTDNITALYFTYSIMYGVGASLAYTPSLAILGHYFQRYLGLVNGVVTAASPVFSIVVLQLMNYLVERYNNDLSTLFRFQAGITLGVALCGFLFKPIDFMMAETPKREGRIKAFWKTVINVEIFKKTKYVIWALAFPIALLGYFVPYAFMQGYIKEKFPGENRVVALQCLLATSGVSRLVVGYVSDKKGVNRIVFQQVSFFVMGILTILIPFLPQYWMIIVIMLGIGICDGGFIALLGPVAIDLCGSKYAAQAIGTLLGLASIPVSSGPPIIGAILKATGSFTVPIVVSGIPPIIGASLMFFIHYTGRNKMKEAGPRKNDICGVNDDGMEPIPLREQGA